MNFKRYFYEMEFNLETKRLILRELRPEDAEGIFELDADPLVHQFLGNEPIRSMEEAKTVIDHIQAQYQRFGIGRWAMIEKRSGHFMGWSGLKFMEDDESGHTNYFDIGYRIIPRYWGKGYATESAKEALRYGFQVLQLPEIIGTVNELNTASRRVLEKCGLHFGEQYVWKQRIPCAWLSIRKEEWEQLQQHT